MNNTNKNTQYRPNQQRVNTNRTNASKAQPTRQQQVKPKVDFKNPDPNASKGCLSFMVAFWIRSAIFSLAIYLALRCLGLVGGNGMVLKRESLEGPVTFATQEYELTDQDLETFTALMNDELTNEQKEVVYSLGK